MSELSDLDLGLPSESAHEPAPFKLTADEFPAPVPDSKLTVGQKLDSVLDQLNDAERAMYTARVMHIVYAAEAVIPTYNRQ